ncbi:long-chain acyl-CoA synthetase [Aliiroseovarius sediminilitoris]|uniref:3-methylmercaptopropionyl-CoA ligase n=1 Tax=Aliiroseovarius sediminilitoris TaxID=1173584 RepID=A0A1I0QJ61_9RHOB|nr:AMP-binding protein [Aliiroseovarius sediminilitoris]SEW27074.1 long-chain acyl-CoA synthetase [Aliiroseovarius sediminilitoris]
MNFAEWLLRTAARTPDAPALMKGDKVVASYADFARSAAAIGVALQQSGIEKGDRVALFMTNRTEYLETLYGIWFAGAVAVPINAKLHPKEAAWIMADSGSRSAFVSDDVAGEIKAETVTGLTARISVDAPEFDTMRATAPMAEPVEMSSDDLAWLFYTSGTTGKPKGVMMSCGNLMAMTLSYFVDVDTVEPQDAILYAAPMSHGAGLYNFMHVLRGARHVVPDSGGFDAAEILDLAPQLKNVSMFAAPTMVRRLVDAAKSRGRSGEGIKTIVYAGGPMYLADIIEAVDVIGPKFVQIYGQGECPMAITALTRTDVADRTHDRWRARLASVGMAQSVVRVRIVDRNGRELPRGETGEIVVKGTTVMLGYWQNTEATANTIRDGWLWTGDMGQMDDDGYVTLQDRSKDMIVSGGSNIYPREVEEVLLTHPNVREVAVVGRPDAEWGEVVVAFVAPHPNAAVDPQELDALCLSQIARFKRPKDYVLVANLPKNNYGKVLKTELRKRLEIQGCEDE